MSIENINSIVGILGLFGVVLTVLNTWLIFAVRSFRDDVRALQGADGALSAKLAQIEILVAGKYITRDEFSAALDRQTSTILGALGQMMERMQGARGMQGMQGMQGVQGVQGVPGGHGM